MNLATGIGPLDERITGLRRGGTYLLTGGADTAKLAFLLQYLDAGLRDGQRVALLSAAPRSDVLELADYYGFTVRRHWHDGSCVLLGFKGEYPRRVVHAPDPNEAFEELEALLAPPVDRVAVDPGSFLWSTRAGTAMAQGFVDWAERSGATVAASVASGLDDRPDPSTEWVLQRAAGVLHFARLPTGLHEVEVRRLTPPVDAGPITLELAAGHGLVAPSGPIERRRTDRDSAGVGFMILVELGARAPSDLAAWLERNHDVERLEGGMALVRRLQGDPVGLVCLYVERSRTEEAVDLIRTIRPLTAAPLLLLSDHDLRSGDRAAALDAGADDVLSDGIDLKELDARIRRARESARREAMPESEGGPVPVDGLLDPDEFGRLLDERLSSDEEALFSLLRIEPAEIPNFGAVLIDSVRAESGDLVAPLRGGFGVLLQDARTQQAEAFLHRVQSELRQRGYPATVRAEILSSPDQADRIRGLIGA